jgi:hypothetical protein
MLAFPLSYVLNLTNTVRAEHKKRLRYRLEYDVAQLGVSHTHEQIRGRRKGPDSAYSTLFRNFCAVNQPSFELVGNVSKANAGGGSHRIVIMACYTQSGLFSWHKIRNEINRLPCFAKIFPPDRSKRFKILLPK